MTIKILINNMMIKKIYSNTFKKSLSSKLVKQICRITVRLDDYPFHSKLFYKHERVHNQEEIQ